MSTGPARIAAVEPKFIELEVLGNESLSPHLRRVTLGGEEVAAMTPQGFDQWFRMFMRKPGQQQLHIPTSPTRWFPQYLTMSGANRPLVRNYTVRSFRPGVNEIDIDFVVHEDPGPGAAWALDAKRGERAVILDEGLLYNDSDLPGDVLIVGDTSALPAIAGITESIDRNRGGVALIEVNHPDDRQEFNAPENLEVHWLVGKATEQDGQLALRTLPELQLSEHLAYAYVAGESGLAAGTRRHLVRERGLSKQQVTFTGYWKHGKGYM
ncbi:siderophore-interacting protein [Humidisolicoccus flavus]|uniref:siderophore-interacting protein n=1 Tax=Humidisolicoccus flavus TaxID=3111414 RepID=UPI0032538D3F